MFVSEKFLADIIKIYGRYPVSTDGGGSWYPQACEFLKLDHHIHSSLEKSLIERTMQYVKDRTEGFDDYFPCRKQNCKLDHIKQWIKVFACSEFIDCPFDHERQAGERIRLDQRG
jgi:putative transposase